MICFPYKSEALLYYMAVEFSDKRQIATLLWEDCDEISSARKNLRTCALYGFVKCLEKKRITSPYQTKSGIKSRTGIEVIMTVFLEEMRKKPERKVYKSDFLQNFYLKIAGAFEDWIMFKKGKIKRDLFEPPLRKDAEC